MTFGTIARLAVAAQKKSDKHGIKRANPNPTAIPPAMRPSSGHIAKPEEIIDCGKKRRGEIAVTPKPTGLAAKIIEAGAKRRGEIV